MLQWELLPCRLLSAGLGSDRRCRARGSQTCSLANFGRWAAKFGIILHGAANVDTILARSAGSKFWIDFSEILIRVNSGRGKSHMRISRSRGWGLMRA